MTAYHVSRRGRTSSSCNARAAWRLRPGSETSQIADEPTCAERPLRTLGVNFAVLLRLRTSTGLDRAIHGLVADAPGVTKAAAPRNLHPCSRRLRRRTDAGISVRRQSAVLVTEPQTARRYLRSSAYRPRSQIFLTVSYCIDMVK